MINAIAIEGNLGNAPDVRILKSGKKVARFNIAHTRRWKSGEGFNEETLWVRCEVWDWQADKVSEFTKGTPVIVIGEIRLDEYERKDGTKYSGFKVYVKEVRELTKKRTPLQQPPIEEPQSFSNEDMTKIVDDIPDDIDITPPPDDDIPF